jgi:hypothetical protein
MNLAQNLISYSLSEMPVDPQNERLADAIHLLAFIHI